MLSAVAIFLVKFIVVNIFILGIFYILSKADTAIQRVAPYIAMGVVVVLLKISSIAILLSILLYFFAPQDSIFFSVVTEVINVIVILFISVLLWLKLSSVPSNRLKNKVQQERQDKDYEFFLQVEQEALAHSPNPEALWQYSMLLGQLNQTQINTHWKPPISKEAIAAIAKKYFQQALRHQSLSATVAFAYQQISKSIENSKIIDISTVETSLDQLINALAVQCHIKYPVINHQQIGYQKSRHWDLRDIVKSGRASFIDKYGLTETLIHYPSLHNRCDVMQLRQDVVCQPKKKSIYMLLRYLIDSPVPPFQYKWHSPLRHLVYLSVLAELLGKSDMMDLLNKQGLEQDKAAFNQQRQSLKATYYHAFGDTTFSNSNNSKS